MPKQRAKFNNDSYNMLEQIVVPQKVQSVWAVGLHALRGLEYDAETGVLWGSQLGSRGGERINPLFAEVNSDWPLTSLCGNHQGSCVEDKVYIEFDKATA